MTCRQCGTVIAEKALICYKCGTPTTEAKYAPVPIRGDSRQRTLILLAVLLIVSGVYGGLVGSDQATRVVGAVVAGGGAVYLAARLFGQRRR